MALAPTTNSYMILRSLALSNINCSTVILENRYSHLSASIRRKYSLEFPMFVRLLFLSKLLARRVYRCFAEETVLLRVWSTMLVRNSREMDLSPFELPLKTVKNPRIIRLCRIRRVLRSSTSPEFLAVSIFTRQPGATLKVHRFRKKIDRGEHQHCRRRGPRNGMLLTWRWRRRWRIEGEIFLLRSERRRCRSSN